MAPLSPADAEVALRTFPRRWRSLLGGLDPNDPDTEVRLRQLGPDGRSAVDAASEAVAALEVADVHIRKAVSSDRPSLRLADAPTETTLDEALGRIDVAAPVLATTVASVASGDLDRQAELGGRTVTVRSLLSEVVQQVAELLRSADRALHTRP